MKRQPSPRHDTVIGSAVSKPFQQHVEYVRHAFSTTCVKEHSDECDDSHKNVCEHTPL